MTDTTNDGHYAKAIFGHIDECLTDEIGPVASILCQEALQEWVRELKVTGEKRTLKTVPLYVDKLVPHIEDPDDQKRFIDAVYSIDALRYYKK